MTSWAQRFEGVTSIRERRVLHTMMARAAQRELIDEKTRKIRAMERKLLDTEVGTDSYKLLAMEIRSLKETIEFIREMPLLKSPREAMRMGWSD